MIYFLPVGGLANRLRSMDSIIYWAKKSNKSVTVLWCKNFELNCSFLEIFQPISIPNVDINVIDCPVGFPFNFIHGGNNGLSFSGNTLKRRLKNILKRRYLSVEQTRIVKELKALDNTSILLNDKHFDPVYLNLDKHNLNAYRGLDIKITEEMKPIILKTLNNENADVFISSCYRFSPLEGNYSYLKPLPKISERIENVASNFNNTIGLHIRRGDHKVAAEFSGNEKFIDVIDHTLSKDGNCNFFLSSDDLATKEFLDEKYGEKIIANEVSSFDRNTENAIKEAVLDIFCLSKTRLIYGSHQSSFSQVAADIGAIKEVTVK